MNSASRSRWWIAPLVGTLVGIPLLAISVTSAGLVALGSDSCEPGGCPLTNEHFNVGGIAMQVSLGLGVVAWPSARWLGRAVGVLVAILCPVAMLVSIIALLTIPTGK
ncbi:MAG TPA: hypothetical protein VG317_16490 [Pseudonocardiaceae bacterium]|jgi:hypothetical protein|nr:hypothetical protein [Pseudonocardiaceae bacterium]